jgi:hypothetical protein
LTPDLPAEMARTLDNQVSRAPPVDHYHDRHTLNDTPGFFCPRSVNVACSRRVLEYSPVQFATPDSHRPPPGGTSFLCRPTPN